jgi:hypothetical protein
MLQAVAMPAGTHRVEFTYRSTYLDLGLLLTEGILGLIALGLALAAGRAVVRHR